MTTERNGWRNIEADNDIDFQDVTDVIAIERIAGVDRVGLLTEDGNHLPMAALGYLIRRPAVTMSA